MWLGIRGGGGVYWRVVPKLLQGVGFGMGDVESLKRRDG